MNTPIDPTSQKVTVLRVSDDERVNTLPRHFGRNMMRVEDSVYNYMRQLVREYRGGYWQFYELSNGGFYMAPEMERVKLEVVGNGYSGEMSAEAAGITVCLFAFSHLSFALKDDAMTRHYYQLRDFAIEHAEAGEILSATD